MKFEVLSRNLASIFKHDRPWAAISIISKPTHILSISQENRVGILILSFMDVDDPTLPDRTSLVKHEEIFTIQQANTILDFMLSVKDSIELLMIHCDAGASRSPAVAAALSLIFYDTVGNWFVGYVPNKLVFRLILKAAEERGLWKRKEIVIPEPPVLDSDQTDLSLF